MKPLTGAGAGLPFTWLMDPLGTWAYSPLDGVSASGVQIQPTGVNWKQGEVKNPKDGYFSSSAHSDMALINTEPPRYNMGNGNLYFSQGMSQSSVPYSESTMSRANYVSNTALTFSSPGRFNAQELTRPSPYPTSPGNYSYQAWVGGTSIPIGDMIYRPNHDATTGSDARVGTVGHCATVCTYTAADPASGGWGRQWGDSHDTIHQLNLGATFISQTDATTIGYGIQRTRAGIASDGLPMYWTLNVDSVEHWNDTDATPGGNPSSSVKRSWAGAGSNRATLAHFAFADYDGAGTPELGTIPIGAPHLGNTVIADSCGVVGFDGVFVATAQFSNSSQDSATPVTGFGYCAINIMVHTGSPMLRTPQVSAKRVDNTFVSPHGDMMATNCGMDRNGVRDAAFTNRTTLFEGLTRENAETAFTAPYAQYFVGKTHSVVGLNAQGLGVEHPVTSKTAHEPGSVTRIVGESGQNMGTSWGKTVSLDVKWAADKYPTKVRVVPSLLGKDSSGTPIVDYHVLVSLTTSPTPTKGVNTAFTGDPTVRNNPDPSNIHRDVDLSGQKCEIWHGIFRLNPTYGPVGSVQINSAQVLKATSTWGLHQITPFRPLANATWLKIPQLCSTIEAGGVQQRGGIAHMWDADAYGGELFVGADVAVPADLSADSPSGTDSDGKNLYGVYGHGQTWAGAGAMGIGIPREQQLFVFRYSPSTDPWHPGSKNTTPTTNKLGVWLNDNAPLLANKDAAFDAAIHNASHSVTDVNLKSWRGWEIHDWVFPSGELLPYLGNQLPTIHCSSLRIVDDGRMLMAAIQRDYVGTENCLPSIDIGWPYNPDIFYDYLPPGYYVDPSGVVQPFGTGVLYNRDDGAGNAFVPQAGTYVTGATIPNVASTSQAKFSGMDTVFGFTPPWNKSKIGSWARSLVLLFTDTKATDGRVTRGRALFDVSYYRENGAWNQVETWNEEDTWWSGSQISYWYPESGQRAIPITYGTYPECRMSYAHLPRCSPYLGSDGQMKNGFPLLQTIHTMEPGFGETIDSVMSGPTGGNDVRLNGWWKDHWDFLTIHRFVPTTIGFADYGPSANPWQEFGWSGWSFPSNLYQPLGNTDAGQFTEIESTDTTAVTAPWAEFGKFNPTSPSEWMVGPQSAICHHGPLHWGLSENTHPFITDRVWKQVNAGLGYDIPLHLLKPGAVRVRARAGNRNSLDLELETPFHITDNIHLQGVSEYYDRISQTYAKGTQDKPGGARPVLGQYYLRTNLWAMPSASTKLPDVGADDIRGPMISGTFNASSLAAIWKDHPTEHFHCGALPTLPGSDIDYQHLINNRYPAPMLAKSNEVHPIDAMVQGEQLQSSVDVHVSKGTLPVWDSGSIVSGRAMGESSLKVPGFVNRGFSRGSNALDPTTPVNNVFNSSYGYPAEGYGQTILRTPDGTLHRFVFEQSAGYMDGADWDVCIRHYTKPLFSDLFWNRRASTVEYPTSPVRLKDEIPLTFLDSNATKFGGFAAASDSTGRIHLMIEATVSGQSRVFHVTTEGRLESYNPEPVWTWDWSGTIGKTVCGTVHMSQPYIAVDSQDNIHATWIHQLDTSTGTLNKVVYYRTTSSGSVWGFDGTFGSLFTQVNKHGLSALSTLNPTRCLWAHSPKLHLKKNNSPIIVWGGYDYDAAATDAYNQHHVWANVATLEQGQITFNEDSGVVVSGKNNCSHWTVGTGMTGVQFWDSTVDTRDNLHIVYNIKTSASTLPSGTPAAYFVECRMMNTESSLISQYDINNGVGASVLILEWVDDVATRKVDCDWQQMTMTVDSDNSVHLIIEQKHAMSLSRQDENWRGANQRAQGGNDKSAYPMDYPGSLQPDANAYNISDEFTSPSVMQPSVPLGLTTVDNSHLIELWWPAYEISHIASTGTKGVLRSLNMRWLSVPGMSWDADSGWVPIADAGMAGTEDFTHEYPQLRYQRYHGFNSEMDLTWFTDMLSVYQTQYSGSGLYFWNGGL